MDKNALVRMRKDPADAFFDKFFRNRLGDAVFDGYFFVSNDVCQTFGNENVTLFGCVENAVDSEIGCITGGNKVSKVEIRKNFDYFRTRGPNVMDRAIHVEVSVLSEGAGVNFLATAATYYSSSCLKIS